MQAWWQYASLAHYLPVAQMQTKSHTADIRRVPLPRRVLSPNAVFAFSTVANSETPHTLDIRVYCCKLTNVPLFTYLKFINYFNITSIRFTYKIIKVQD